MKSAIEAYFDGNWLPALQRYVRGRKVFGDEYRACCPFHKNGQEKHPSWSANITTGQYKCQACGARGDIYDLYAQVNNLDIHRDFPKILEGIANDFGIPTNGRKKSSGKIVKRYPYHNENGDVLFVKDRWEPKGFSISHHNRNGHYANGMGGASPVPYNLPAVIATDEVIIVEGEKDADRLNDIGLVSTTNFDGADKWRESYNQYFEGKDVKIIPDDDGPGHRHAGLVARNLNDIAKSVRIVRLPNPENQKGYDVSDFMSEFTDPEHAAERLSIMIDSAEPYNPETDQDFQEDSREKGAEYKGETKEEKPECYLEPLEDSDDDSDHTYEWLIEKLVPKGEPMAMGGKGGSGKSSLALECSAQIMENDPDANVVYVCAEGAYRDTKIKARQMGLPVFGRFHFLKRADGGTSFKLSSRKDLELVSTTLSTAAKSGLKIVFVVIDSIRGMHKGSLNEDVIGEVMQSVNNEICTKLGATVCYIHHGKKYDKDSSAMDAFIGSVYIVNTIRHGLFLWKVTPGLREVEVAKTNLDFDGAIFRAEKGAGGRINLAYAGIRTEDGNVENDSQLGRAEEIILSMIGTGDEVPAYQIYRRGEEENPPISPRTMKRVKKARAIESIQRNNKWYWRMPAGDIAQ